MNAAREYLELPGSNTRQENPLTDILRFWKSRDERNRNALIYITILTVITVTIFLAVFICRIRRHHQKTADGDAAPNYEKKPNSKPVPNQNLTKASNSCPSTPWYRTKTRN